MTAALIALLLAAAPETVSYWIAPCQDNGSGCRSGDEVLAEWALQAWERSAGGALALRKVAGEEKARIRIYWAGPRSGLYGEARPILVDGKRGAEVYVRPDLRPLGAEIAEAGRRDPLFRDTVVYLTCLHESGHALGLPHTAGFDDIMYSFQFGGDIPEYFARYRRKLTARDDIRRVSAISPADRSRLLAVLADPGPAKAGQQAEARPTVAVPELVSVNRIWDKAPHNAFTDLAMFRGRFYCVFREGAKHVSPDGALRVITSSDGEQWNAAALLQDPRSDLRDAKLSITPDNRLMLSGAAAYPPPSPVKHQSLAWFSSDGRDWSAPERIGDPNMWLWRVSWHRGKAYSFGYSTGEQRYLRSYLSFDGARFDPLAENVFDKDYPNETSILFRNDDSALCLLRRDSGAATAQLGRSRPPYRAWTWEDLGVRIGGPHMIALPDGRIVAAVRLYDSKPRTSLCWLDPNEVTLKEFLPLPSGGDTSYAGLVWHQGLLWVSYYSSHEEKTAIYLAKVKIPPRKP